jgi:hypothetical protein
MDISPLKKVMFLVMLGGLLLLTGCTTTAEPLWKAGPASPGPWWKGKPWSQMTPAEREEQANPDFWQMYGHLHGLGE